MFVPDFLIAKSQQCRCPIITKEIIIISNSSNSSRSSSSNYSSSSNLPKI